MGRIRRGFILPMVLFGLAIMGVLVLAVVSTSDDDRHGSRNVLESTRSFYAADAGLNQIVAEFDLNDYRDLVSTPGTTADLGWQSLPGRAGRYRGVIRKLADNLIELTVDGRAGGAGPGRRAQRRGPGPPDGAGPLPGPADVHELGVRRRQRDHRRRQQHRQLRLR